jgi:hypothetical protein
MLPFPLPSLSFLLRLLLLLLQLLQFSARQQPINTRSSADGVLRLQKLIVGWSALRRAINEPPRTCVQWSSALRSAFKALQGLPFAVPRLPRKSSSYSTQYTVRCLLLMLMHQKSVPGLRLREVSLPAFLAMNPDMNKHLSKISNSMRPSSASQLLAVTGHSGARPELLSMAACFAGDKALDDMDASNFDEQEWGRFMQDYHRRHGIWPIPAVVHKSLSGGT